MKGWWCRGATGTTAAVAGVGVLVVTVVGLLAGVEAEGKGYKETSFWPPTKDLNTKLEDMFSTSAHKASQKMSKLLMGEENTRA